MDKGEINDELVDITFSDLEEYDRNIIKRWIRQAKQEVINELEKDILSIAVKGEITFDDMGKLLSKKKKEVNE